MPKHEPYIEQGSSISFDITALDGDSWLARIWDCYSERLMDWHVFDTYEAAQEWVEDCSAVNNDD